MKTTNYVYSVIIFLSITCCKNNNSNSNDIPDHEHFEAVYIDPQKSIALKTGDFVDSVQFVPLETTKESEFSEIAQIEILDDRYIILDKNTGQILFFNKQGKFLKKISPDSDQLPTPYKNVVDFVVDRGHKRLYFNDLQSANKFEFNLDGSFLQMQPKEKIDYNIRESHYLDSCRISYFAYRTSPGQQATPYNVTVFKDNVAEHSYLPFDAAVINRDDVYGTNSYFFESEGVLFFSKPYDTNIYRFDGSGNMVRAFEFEFPNSLRLPEDFTSNPKYSQQRKRFIKANEKKIYLITDFFQTDSNLLFKLVGGKSSDQFLYDLSGKSLVSLTKYISGPGTNFLPILGASILGMDNGRVLSTIPAKRFIDLINNHSKNGGDIHALSKDIQEIYNRGNDQNPVLVLTSFKKEISYASKY